MAPAAGVVIVAVGAPPLTVSVALLLVAVPKALVTTARKVAPLSPAAAVNVNVGLVAPAMLVVPRCH